MYVCPHCHRANPTEAAFCHFDGTGLRPAHREVEPSSYNQLPHEFVFTSGRCCRTYDDLARGCQEEWLQARDLLLCGVLTQFLASVGRLDLAQAADEARSRPDPDIALETFIARLPTTLPCHPRLDVFPRRLVLGTMPAGATRQVVLTISNQGQGLLHGLLAVGAGRDWLRIAQPELEREMKETGLEMIDDGLEAAIKTSGRQEIVVHVDTRKLTGPQSYVGRLTVVTNGGNLDMPVLLEVDAQRFPCPPFQGARTARELAEQMRAQPREAVPLLESGEVARWFAANGWTYPVRGPTAPGMAAVQQFFEELKLSRPPVVQAAETDLHVTCFYPEITAGQVRLRTADRKWIYAHADSDVLWLRVTSPQTCGPRQTLVSFEIDSSLLEPDQLHEGTLVIVANAGQRLAVRVRADVRRPEEPLTRRLWPFAGEEV
jgi:hypothetical protein